MSLIEKLKELEKKELIDLIVDVSKLRNENEEFLKLKISSMDTMYFVLKIYKQKIDMFFKSDTLILKEFRLIISDFKKINNEDKFLNDIMVYSIEHAILYTKDNGDLIESHYTYFEGMFQKCVDFLIKNREFILLYKPRLEKVVKESHNGFGHYDIYAQMITKLEGVNQSL